MSRSNLLAILLAIGIPYGLLVHNLIESGASEKAIAAQLAERGRPAAEVAVHRANAAWFGRTVALLNMSLMFLGLYAGLGPLTGRALDRGAREVTEQLRAADRRAEHAHQELEEARAALEKIDEDVTVIRDRERKAAGEERERLEQFARNEAKQILDHAELSIARELKHAREELVARVAGRAVEVAVQDLESALDDEVRLSLQRRMIEGVGA